MPKVPKIVVRLRRNILNKNIVTINGFLNFPAANGINRYFKLRHFRHFSSL